MVCGNWRTGVIRVSGLRRSSPGNFGGGANDVARRQLAPYFGPIGSRWYHGEMTLFRRMFFISPVACLLAQTPPPPSPPKPAPATQPAVTMSVDNPNTKPMPVVPPERVVITVGDTTLTAAQLDQIIDSLPEQYRAAARGAGRKQFADNIVRI